MTLTPFDPARTTKIIAVHLSYPSRAAQRGRTPAFASYFMKPTSSMAGTGGEIERPADTELLAFEGEIALVIGQTVRRVTAQEGWAAVSGVTAANDFGVYDLRLVDKGSNLRNKGGDGFTPIGPFVIDTDGIEQGAFRVRTWVNGELAQSDTSDTLLFGFGQVVSDLSQLLTLEPGDVILTGTPAGSSVVVPGDVVEVEVDAPQAPGSPSTGRLVTTVTQGTALLPPYSAPPQVDDDQRAEAWGSREAAGLPPAPAADETADAPDSAATHEPAGFELTPEWKAKINSVATATLSAQLRKRGLNNVSIDGLHSTKPDARLVGRARTLRYVPNREDLFAAHGEGYNAQKRVIDSLTPDDVLVMEARGEHGSGTIGDILALRAQVLGAAGIVTDGGLRDLAIVSGLDIPTYHGGAHPAVLGRRHVPWDIDLTIACGGAAVQPGDVIVGDADGLLVIPPPLVEEVVDAAIEQEQQELFIAERVEAGEAIEGLFPMNADWRARYLEWQKSR
ncbi:fumarylacetoacetate hydrolase family protein [Subtercola sp. YIM 133946]|uniref:fumarylacetoacetate hydrolase family protein n=1 Tax=Subtercola sp. YIM 133946 TaxID=3118909 RepID=UPI002F950E0F